MGFLDRPQKDPSIPENDPESGKTALAVAEEGIVLLKNEKKTLPFDQTRIKKIAVLGPERATRRAYWLGKFLCHAVLRSERA